MSDTCHIAVTEEIPVCLRPLQCWRKQVCLVEVERLRREEDLGRLRADSCFLSLMTWVKADQGLARRVDAEERQ